MALTYDAEQELRALLRTFRAAHSGMVAPAAAGKALELWVLMKLAQAGKATPRWSVTLRRGDGTPLPPGTPFNLPSQGTGIAASHPDAPGFVLLERRRHGGLAPHQFELHGGLRWMGRSGATHECDVSVLPAVVGQSLRDNGGGHPHGLPVAAIECKDKGGTGTLDETRQTLARMYDLALVTRPPFGQACRIYENRNPFHKYWGHRSSSYVAFFAKGTFAIVRAGTFQMGTEALASHYRINRHPSIYTDAAQIQALQLHFRMTLSNSGRF